VKINERQNSTTLKLADWQDPRVQLVYRLLCSDEQPPMEDHWEGYAARRIVAELERADPQTTSWAALHRRDGKELTDSDAPGYHRVPYTTDGGARWPKTEEWGWVMFASAWDAPVGGNCISVPRLQPIKAGWAK
jgi:hypothetical protein